MTYFSLEFGSKAFGRGFKLKCFFGNGLISTIRHKRGYGICKECSTEYIELLFKSVGTDDVSTRKTEVKNKNNKCCKNYETKILTDCWWKCKVHSHFGKHAHILTQHFKA